MLVRGPSLAATMSRYLIDSLDAATNVVVLPGTEVVGAAGDGRLERIALRDATGEREVDAAALFVLIGAVPHTAWLPARVERDPRGYVHTGPLVHPYDRWPLPRPPQPFETSVPGVFAVGDVRAQSVKRVASAVGEGSVVIGQVHQRLAELESEPTPAEDPAWR